MTLFPIFLTVFGFGLYSKVAFGMFHGIFPIMIIAMNATREVSPVHLKVARSLRLSRLGDVPPGDLPVDLPGAADRAAARLQPRRCSASSSGEMFASRAGFGYELVEAITLHDMPRMYGIVAVLVIIAFVVNALFLRWERAAERRGDRSGALAGRGRRRLEQGVERGLLRLQRGRRLDVLLDARAPCRRAARARRSGPGTWSRRRSARPCRRTSRRSRPRTFPQSL